MFFLKFFFCGVFFLEKKRCRALESGPGPRQKQPAGVYWQAVLLSGFPVFLGGSSQERAVSKGIKGVGFQMDLPKAGGF